VTEDSLDKTTLSERIAAELRRRISKRMYQPHSYMPSERQLTREFGVTRATLRRALDALEADGLVIRTQGQGTRVLHALDRLDRPLVGVVHWLSCESGERCRLDSVRTLDGVMAAVRDLGCRHQVVSITKNPVKAEWLAEQFGAVVLVDPFDAQIGDVIGEVESKQVPCVVAKLEHNINACGTWVDHQKAACEAVRALVGLGHRRIGLVAREPKFAFYAHTRQGYVAGLEEAAIPLDESIIGTCDKTDALSGYFATKPLLDLPDPPTGIIAARDAIAEGVCRAAKEKGLSLGQHLSVIGFDDVTWPQSEPFLTTFHEPCYEMGYAAVEMLLDRIMSGSRTPVRRKLELPFVLRRSAGPPLSWTVATAPVAEGADAGVGPADRS